MVEVRGVSLREIRRAVREWNKHFSRQVNTKLTGEALPRSLIEAVEATRKEEGDQIFQDLSKEFVDIYNRLLEGGGFLDESDSESQGQQGEQIQDKSQEEDRMSGGKQEKMEQKRKKGKQVEKRPGVIKTMAEYIREEGPVTVDQIVECLEKKFPNRDVKAMASTVKANLSFVRSLGRWFGPCKVGIDSEGRIYIEF